MPSEHQTYADPAPYRLLAEANTPEWLEARRHGIGSSDAPSLLGQTTWGSPASVLASKKLPPEEKDREAFFWGHALEPIILARYTEQTGRIVKPAGGLLQKADAPHLLATPDGMQFENPSVESEWTTCGRGIAEAKLVGWKVDDWKIEPPPYVITQVQHQMMVTGFLWATVVALLRGVELKWWDIRRDDEFINEKLRPVCDDMWQRHVEDLPLPVDGSEATTEAMKRLYAEMRDETVALGSEELDLAAERTAIMEQLADLEKRKRKIENHFRARLQGAHFGQLPNGKRASLSLQTRKAYMVPERTYRILRIPKVEVARG